ncbi:MAG: Gfo/Idh/MocA family oxidoreductase [Streptococcaceae bacterium]|nr:Gfo/Idh/MocA family oxidoreductase [Streptococcaceae bacterium]
MKIGVIGASSAIAQKAYLPVYASLQATHEFVIYSRELSKAEAIRARFGFSGAADTLSALTECDAVAIHAATRAHFELAKRFLSAGIPVFMDKPISENLAEAEELLAIAKKNQLLFMVGFNRRFAPQVDKLKAISDKNFIQTTKNLIDGRGEPRFKLFDVFVHPLDTLIYLLDAPIISWDGRLKTDENGHVTRVLVQLETAHTTGLATMNLHAGAYSEEFTVSSPTGTHRVSDLTHYEHLENYSRQLIEANGWHSAPENRGFTQMIDAFLSALTAPKAVDLRQDNVLLSHQIITELLEKR